MRARCQRSPLSPVRKSRHLARASQPTLVIGVPANARPDGQYYGSQTGPVDN